VHFFTNVTDFDLLIEDSVLLNCQVRLYGSLMPNITVELTDRQSGRLTFKEYSQVRKSTIVEVQYNVRLTSTTVGPPFYCTVTATVGTMETVSRTLSVTVFGELFEHVSLLVIPSIPKDSGTACCRKLSIKWMVAISMDTTFIFFSFSSRDALRKRRLCCGKMLVRPSVCLLHASIVLIVFSPSGNYTIQVFLYQSLQHYSDVDPPLHRMQGV